VKGKFSKGCPATDFA